MQLVRIADVNGVQLGKIAVERVQDALADGSTPSTLGALAAPLLDVQRIVDVENRDHAQAMELVGCVAVRQNVGRAALDRVVPATEGTRPLPVAHIDDAPAVGVDGVDSVGPSWVDSDR